MKRPVLLAAAALACTITLPGYAADTLGTVAANNKITFAYRDSSVPFSYLAGADKPVGFGVDISNAVLAAVKKELGKNDIQVGWQSVTSANRIPLLVNGTIDLECGSTTNNAERREKVAFTVPHYIAGARYLVKANSPIQEIRDFQGRTLVSTEGTTPLKTAIRVNAEHNLGMRIVKAPDHARAIDMVASGEADGFVMDDVLLYGLAAGRPDPNQFKVVGKFLTIEPLAIMLPRNDPEFKKLVDEEMKRLIRSREAHTVYETWFLKPIAPSNRSLNLPMNYLLKDFWKYPTDQVPG